MSRLQVNNTLPLPTDQKAAERLVQELTRIVRLISLQVNGVSEGRIEASYTAQTAAPTTGTWFTGDFVKNSAPAETGSVGSKYVVLGWVCSAEGTPGTWLACRALTGN